MFLGVWPSQAETIKIAIFHTELSRKGPGLLLRDILNDEPQVVSATTVLKELGADILVLAGVDFDYKWLALNEFTNRVGGYPYRYSKLPNRGFPTFADIDGDGRLGEPEDAHGYGEFAGQSGLAVISKFPIVEERVRDFSALQWRDLPGNNMPEGVEKNLRLSTTSHWIVPIDLPDGRTVNLMAWHATPPVFDGPDDRNGWRNHDEAAFWLGMLNDASPEELGSIILAGIANLDLHDGEGRRDALLALLEHDALQDPLPASQGGKEAAASEGGVNARHQGDPALDTVNWNDHGAGPGNLRVAYVLPSAAFTVKAAGVFWPSADTSLGRHASQASRHRAVWVDVLLECGGDGSQCIGLTEAGH